MQKIKACAVAFILLILFALGLHIAVGQINQRSQLDLGRWTMEGKFRSASLMREHLGEDTLLVMGSSELEHGKDTPYQLLNLSKSMHQEIMAVGAGYYQSLFHATALAALEGKLAKRKVALLVSPQWFRKSGVKDKAYASRFAEENYIDMLRSSAISEKTKHYIAERTDELLQVDEATRKRAARYNREYLAGTASAADRLVNRWYLHFLEEKNQTMIARDIAVTALTGGLRDTPQTDETDFAVLAQKAQEDAAKVETNEFYVEDDYYQAHITNRLDKVKDQGIKTGYTKSPEYDDLRCFLDVCRETGIEPLLVIIPVNGYWYDYIGFDKENRDTYYANIRQIAKDYDVEVADFSDKEYEPYFMEDTVHIGWKGWVETSEAILRFAKEEKAD